MTQTRQPQLDRCVVAIVDIESFTTRRPGDQTTLVETFVRLLDSGVQESAELHLDAWSTGDGAIISMGRNVRIDDRTVSSFISFLLDFMTRLLSSGIVVRTAVNYSERDRMVKIPARSALKGGFVQVGDGINDAARIITFCESRELLVNDSFFRLLRQLDETPHRFRRNDPLRTKHGQVLQTYSYEPDSERTGLFYSPDSHMHRYKRFSSFPPIKSETLEYFGETGLEYEISKVVSRAYAAMETINETKTFLSSSPVLKVLIQMRYTHSDDVVVVSRNDQRGFWNQQRRAEYLGYLRNNAGETRSINQARVLVYPGIDDLAGIPMAHQVLPAGEQELIEELKDLHRRGSFWNFPSSFLFQYEQIAALRFGFTLNRTLGYAVIPVPAPEEIDAKDLHPSAISSLLSRYDNFDPLDGPMKAIVTADPRFIRDLSEEFDDLMASPHIHLLK